MAKMTTETIITEKMTFGGDCLAKIGGKAVFIPYAVPGETLEVEITEEAQHFSRARITRILEPSPLRMEPFCPLYQKCGGCNMQHINSAYQTELRRGILKEAFESKGLSVPEVEVVSGSPTAYRARFQLHNGGLMEKRSNNILPLETCPCATPEINGYLASTPQSERPRGRAHLFGSEYVSQAPNAKGGVVIAHDILANGAKPMQKVGKKKNRNIPRFAGTVPSDNTACSVVLNKKDIRFDVRGFFQSNMEVLSKAIPLITGSTTGKHALDLYSGCGTFSAFLADCFDMVTLVEHNRDALVYAEGNLLGSLHQSYGVSAGEWATRHSAACIEQNGHFDMAVVDPPRAGMEKELCKWLSSSNIPEIRSLSCDCATHARDAACLQKGGYRLEKLYLLDFYPQTCHIESLAVFKK